MEIPMRVVSEGAEDQISNLEGNGWKVITDEENDIVKNLNSLINGEDGLQAIYDKYAKEYEDALLQHAIVNLKKEIAILKKEIKTLDKSIIILAKNKKAVYKKDVEFQKYYSATLKSLKAELKEAYKEHMVVSYKKKFMSYDLIILDELGYISFDKDGSELLFNLLSNRAESKSMIITTNLTFDKWPSLFGDTIMTTAMVDRLTNKANIIQILGDSYRIKQTKDWLKNKN